MSNHVKTNYAVKGGSDPVFVRGLVKFAKLGAPDQWGKNSVRIYPNQETMPRVHKLISEGIKNSLTRDDDGQYSIVFSRPKTIKTKTKGEVELEPVIITDENDMISDDSYLPDGTECTLKLETYGGRSPTGFGSYKAARLAQIKVHGKRAERTIPI